MNTNKEFELNEIRYKILGYFRAEVIEKEEGDCEGDIIIPEKVEYDSIFYLVASIGHGAFFYCTNLKSVTIPNSVTTIGEDAFYNCTSLKSITLPNSVTGIGEDAFYKCTSLKDIICKIEEPLEINSSVFAYVNKGNCTLHVPFESTEKYKNTDVWKEFKIKTIEQK